MGSFVGSCYIHRFCVKFVGYNFKELCIIAVFVINLHCFKMVCSTTWHIARAYLHKFFSFYYLTKSKREVWLCCFVVLNFTKIVP